MKYQGTVYVFDLDDTLVWSPHWYDEAVLDDGGYVVAPGRSVVLKEALELLSKAKDRNMPSQFNDIKLQIEEKLQPDGRNIFFLLIDSNGSPVDIEDLYGYFSNEELEEAGIEGHSRYSEHAAVTEDFRYYRNLDTVGSLGFNPEIVRIYNQHDDNAVILTARKNVPGMNEKIDEVISKKLKKPRAIFTQPLDSKNSGRYKGELLAGIAAEPDVDMVHFYDDNLTYIKGIQNVLDKANLRHKVQIHHVSAKNKPTSYAYEIFQMVKIANKLDKERMYDAADLVDEVILKSKK